MEFDMHYETGGQGRTVLLLLHGNFASWRWWRPVLKSMPHGYRAYAPDLRGCGDSDHPEAGYTIAQHTADLEQLIFALGLPRLHLVGHSLGACIALQYALKHPQRIKTLTLVAPAPAQGAAVLQNAHGSRALMADASAMHSAFRLSENLGNSRKMLQRALMRMMPSGIGDEDFECLLDDAARMSHHAAVGHIQTLNSWDVQDDLPRLKLPVMIMGGQYDRLIPSAALQHTVQMLPKGRLIIWPKVGHAPQLERPQRFRKILLKFIQQESAGPLQRLGKRAGRFLSIRSNGHGRKERKLNSLEAI